MAETIQNQQSIISQKEKLINNYQLEINSLKS